MTFGRPEVQSLNAASDTSSEDLLDAAAAAELRSEHPLGKAIVNFARKQGCPIVEPTSFAYTPGRGIVTQVGGTTIRVGNQAWMADNGISVPALSAHSADTGSEIFVAREQHLLELVVCRLYSRKIRTMS